MTQQTALLTSEKLEKIEDRIFGETQNFMHRLNELSMIPVENEAAVLVVKATLDKLITDMQATSNSLILEGPRSGIHLPGTVLGNPIAVAQGGEAAAA